MRLILSHWHLNENIAGKLVIILPIGVLNETITGK